MTMFDRLSWMCGRVLGATPRPGRGSASSGAASSVSSTRVRWRLPAPAPPRPPGSLSAWMTVTAERFRLTQSASFPAATPGWSLLANRAR